MDAIFVIIAKIRAARADLFFLVGTTGFEPLEEGVINGDKLRFVMT